jgi:hypothetical protein
MKPCALVVSRSRLSRLNAGELEDCVIRKEQGDLLIAIVITLMSGVVFGYILYKAYYNENPQEAGEVLKELIIEKLTSMLREY